MRHTKQNGLSLIELLVSMMIGLFLLGGLVTNLISSSKVDKNREAVRELDSNAQVAMDSIRQAVSHAGYPSTNNIYLDKAFYTEEDGDLQNADCRGGGGLKRDIDGRTPQSSQWTRDFSNADVLTVVSLADNPCLDGKTSCPQPVDMNDTALFYVDCAGGGLDRGARTVSCSADPDVGMNAPGNAKIFNTFSLDTQEKTLICEGNRGGQAILAENIYAMQFLYGVQTSNGQTTYKNADSVENDSQWGLVKSVQVALLMESTNKNVFEKSNTKTKYKLLDRTITIPSSDLHRLYRVYTMTMKLGNVN